MTTPILINQPNVSLAWADAFLTLRATPGRRLSPLTISFTGFDHSTGSHEVPLIRETLNDVLVASNMQKVQTVANTIFPESLWRRAKSDRKALYAEYRENLPDYIAMEPRKNRDGLYFGRLIGFDLDVKTGKRLGHYPPNAVPEDGNQLEFILQHLRPSVRHSMFQACTFDPARDLTAAAQIAFPCLQHLTFVPDFKAKTLELNAFYATQQLFAKGYGNFLGLARLGMFMAGQASIALSRVTCFVGIEKMEKAPRRGAALNALTDACAATLGRVVVRTKRVKHSTPRSLIAATGAAEAR